MMTFPISGMNFRTLTAALVVGGLTCSGAAFAQSPEAASNTPVVASPAVASPVVASPVVASPVVEGAAPSVAPPATVGTTTAQAVTEPDTPVSSCFVPPAKLPDGEVAAFLANPASLLIGNETGGMKLSGKVRGLAGSSSDTLDPLLSLIASANKEQVNAIGSGLARAAIACAAQVNQVYAALIQTKVAEMNSEALSMAFVAGSSDVQTAALGGGASGGTSSASGIGGNGTAGGGSAGLFGDEAIPTVSGEFDGTGEGSFFAANGGGGSDSDEVSPN